MPLRLDTATLSNALADADVKELARGDVRLMITRQPGLRNAVVAAYRRASGLGKSFLEEAVHHLLVAFEDFLDDDVEPVARLLQTTD